MKTPVEPRKEPTPPPGRGAPASYAAYAVRKNVVVRVSVKPAAGESDDLREEGYGHGV